MKAMIFAAGLGTRLKPLTDTMPKALVPVAGKPMLEHVIMRLKSYGFNDIVVNIHHFGEQIIDFLKANNNFGIDIHISDERDMLLDTGGGIKKAGSYFCNNNEPFLVHNVDILSDTDLKELYDFHLKGNNDATLLVSHRQTSRYLVFDSNDRLCGWINKDTGQVKPTGFCYSDKEKNDKLFKEFAFSGIHVISPSLYKFMDNRWSGKFSIMDFYLNNCNDALIGGCIRNEINLIDIGKPETLVKAEKFICRE